MTTLHESASSLRRSQQHIESSPRILRDGFESRAGDAIGVEVITVVRKFSSLARGSDGVPCPTQEHCDLSDVEGRRAVLEHLWNTNVVDDRGPLVIRSLHRSYAG